MSEIVPDKVTYFKASNGATWVANSKNSKAMKRGRDLATTTHNGTVVTVTETEVENKVDTIKITSIGAEDRNYGGYATINFIVDGHSFESGSNSIMDIILHSKMDNGVVTGCPMLWISGNTYSHLVREGSLWHTEALNQTIKTKTRSLPASMVRPGYAYKTENGREFLYLGYGSWERESEQRTYPNGHYNPVITKIHTKEEGHFWKYWYKTYDKQVMEDNIRSRSYEATHCTILKSNKRVIEELQYVDYTLEDMLRVGLAAHPNCHELKTLKVIH